MASHMSYVYYKRIVCSISKVKRIQKALLFISLFVDFSSSLKREKHLMLVTAISMEPSFAFTLDSGHTVPNNRRHQHQQSFPSSESNAVFEMI